MSKKNRNSKDSIKDEYSLKENLGKIEQRDSDFSSHTQSEILTNDQNNYNNSLTSNQQENLELKTPSNLDTDSKLQSLLIDKKINKSKKSINKTFEKKLDTKADSLHINVIYWAIGILLTIFLFIISNLNSNLDKKLDKEVYSRDTIIFNNRLKNELNFKKPSKNSQKQETKKD